MKRAGVRERALQEQAEDTDTGRADARHPGDDRVAFRPAARALRAADQRRHPARFSDAARAADDVRQQLHRRGPRRRRRRLRRPRHDGSTDG